LTDDKELKMASKKEQTKRWCSNNNEQTSGDAATTTTDKNAADGGTDDKEQRMARLQCHEQVKNLMTNNATATTKNTKTQET